MVSGNLEALNMSDMISRSEFDRVQRQNMKRKQELQSLQNQLATIQEQMQALQSERDEAVETVEAITEQYKQFTAENTLFQENAELRSALKQIAVENAIFGSLPEGVSLQNGVGLDEILKAAQIDFDAIEDINEDFVTEAIGKAQAAKPFLFTQSSQPQQAEPQGEVRQETAPPPSLRAFGGQAVGSGAPPEMARQDPLKSVDWSNPAAVMNLKKGE